MVLGESGDDHGPVKQLLRVQIDQITGQLKLSIFWQIDFFDDLFIFARAGIFPCNVIGVVTSMCYVIITVGVYVYVIIDMHTRSDVIVFCYGNESIWAPVETCERFLMLS